MISITRATNKDYQPIVSIGKISVGEAHRDAAPAEDMNAYLEQHYNDNAIEKELNNPDNIYHIISYNNKPVGFSKIIFNATHPDIAEENVTKLDRIYLLKEFQGLKLGFHLLNFNIELAKNNHQSGIWLFTWVGNTRAIDFYRKAGFEIIGSHNFYVTETRYNLNHHMFIDFHQMESV